MSEVITRYVLGFAFNNFGKDVVLIEKKRPSWQAGKWNGVGGHVEGFETLNAAMEREFREETGVTIPADQWVYFASLVTKGGHVSCFMVCTGQVYNVQSATDERIAVTNVRAALESERIMKNLSYLIPLALDSGSSGVIVPPIFHYDRQ